MKISTLYLIFGVYFAILTTIGTLVNAESWAIWGFTIIGCFFFTIATVLKIKEKQNKES